MKTLTEQFHAEVETFLERSGFKATEFGRQAAGDPSLVLNLRRGRSPTLATADRILAFVREHEFLVVEGGHVANGDDGSCGDGR